MYLNKCSIMFKALNRIAAYLHSLLLPTNLVGGWYNLQRCGFGEGKVGEKFGAHSGAFLHWKLKWLLNQKGSVLLMLIPTWSVAPIFSFLRKGFKLASEDIWKLHAHFGSLCVRVCMHACACSWTFWEGAGDQTLHMLKVCWSLDFNWSSYGYMKKCNQQTTAKFL